MTRPWPSEMDIVYNDDHGTEASAAERALVQLAPEMAEAILSFRGDMIPGTPVMYDPTLIRDVYSKLRAIGSS